MIAVVCVIVGGGGYFAWRQFGDYASLSTTSLAAGSRSDAPPSDAVLVPDSGASSVPSKDAAELPDSKVEPVGDLTLAEPSMHVYSHHSVLWFVVSEVNEDLSKQIEVRCRLESGAETRASVQSWNFASQRRYSAKVPFWPKGSGHVWLADREFGNRKRSAEVRVDRNTKVDVPLSESATLEVGYTGHQYKIGGQILTFEANWRWRLGHPLPDHEFTLLVDGAPAPSDHLEVHDTAPFVEEKGSLGRLSVEIEGESRPAHTYKFALGARKKGETVWQVASNPYERSVPRQ